MEGQIRRPKRSEHWARDTYSLESREGELNQDRDRKRARDTHCLESIEQGTRQDRKRKSELGAHFLEGMGRGRTQDTEGKEATERRALTSCSAQREGQVRKQKSSKQTRGTYLLKSAKGGTS
jgi:hypothetical protein